MVALLASLAVWVAIPARPGSRRLMPVLDDTDEGERRSPGWWPLAVVGGALVGVATRVPGIGVAVGVIGIAFAILTARGRARRLAAKERAAVVKAGEMLSGMLRVGAVPATALVAAAAEHPVLSEAAAAQEVGGDVASSLRRSAARAGREGLRDLGAAWDVSALTGASLCETVDAVAVELARREEAAGVIKVELAASTMAARLLAALPLAGLGLGYMLGSDPVRFLIGGAAGQVCLALASVLVACGLLWNDSIAARAAG